MERKTPTHRLSRTVRAWTLLALAVAAGACAAGSGKGDGPDPHDPGVRIHALLEDAEGPVLVFHSGDTVALGEGVRAFYRDRGYRPAWTDERGFLPRGEALVQALHAADREGLDVGTYHRVAVHDLVERARREDQEALPVGDLLGNLDMLLTEAFLRYTTDLVRGTVDPEEADPSWQIPRGDATDAAFLERLVEEEDFEEALAGLRPAVPYYDHLKGALERYRAVVERGGWPTLGEGEPLKKGSRGARVLEVRARLTAEGDPAEAALVQGTVDPDLFDAKLESAVEHFQERHGLDVDGAVGGGTLEQMNVPAEDRLLALKVNLDRWRWLPRELGRRYLLVNVAGFQMAVMEDHEPALSMNVVVGKDVNKTPIFRDTMEYIVVNPYWNVPVSIAREEILPAASRDPGYLARNNYEVVDRSGRTVDAGLASGGDAFTIRQRPGSGNALGRVKFLFPNAMNIYLHDTPADHLFSRSSRAFSHGCIRLEKPDELARYLLETATSRPAADFEALLAAGSEQWVPLEEKLPVYILYFTAWADRNGSVSFYPDIYDRDAAVERVAGGRLGSSGGTEEEGKLAGRVKDVPEA